MITGARGGSSIRCGSWFRSGCSAFCRVTKTSTTMTGSGPTACWRWLSGDLTGEERGRDRGIPLAGHREPVWACPARPRRTGTRRSRSGTISRSTCPSTLVRRREIFPDVDSTDDPVHGNQEGRHFHGYYDCYLPLYREDLILCSRLRPANVDPAAGTAEELARERIRGRWPETVVRGDGGFCRDGTWCEDNGVDYLFGLSRNARPDGAQAIAQVAPPLRLDRRGVAAVLRLPLPDPNVVEPAAAGGGAAGSSRRPLRRDFPGLQAGGGAGPLRETVLRARGEQDQGAARPVRRPDRDHAGEPVAPRLRDVRQPRRRFGGSAWPAPGRTGRRPVRTKLLKVAICISVRRVPLSFSSVWPWKDLFARVLANLRVPPTPT